MMELSRQSEKYALRDLNEKQKVLMDVFKKYNKMLPGGSDKKIVNKGYESLDQRVEKFNV